jgi:hypothetical protein
MAYLSMGLRLSGTCPLFHFT